MVRMGEEEVVKEVEGDVMRMMEEVVLDVVS